MHPDHAFAPPSAIVLGMHRIDDLGFGFTRTRSGRRNYFDLALIDKAAVPNPQHL